MVAQDTEDESTVTTRWLTEYGNDGGHSDGRYRSPRGLRSKVRFLRIKDRRQRAYY